MDDATPIIADRKPCILDLEPGEYHYCTCGRSKGQPFCDGSHAGTGFSPLAFTVQEKKRMALCACKHTGHAPQCDGTHSKL